MRLRIKSSSDVFAARGNPWSDERQSAAYVPYELSDRDDAMEAVLKRHGFKSNISAAEKRLKFRTDDDVELDALLKATKASGKNPDRVIVATPVASRTADEARRIRNISIALGIRLRGK